MASFNAGEILLEARKISKRYGPIVASDSIDLKIRAGELIALVGDNGAGKSTLVKTLSGALQPDSGEILLRGEPITFAGPHEARMKGIETVYQDLALARTLDVEGNLFLGREVRRSGLLGKLGVLNRRAMIRETDERLQKLKIDLPAVSGLPVARLSGGQRQAVAVARAAAWATEVLFMDEPTAALGVRQSQAVLELAKRIASRGTAVVLITHILPHVMEVADRVVVLRHGRNVADLSGRSVTPERLISLMVGFDDTLEERGSDSEGPTDA